MSVQITPEGQLVITCAPYVSLEEHDNRIRAIITLIQTKSDDIDNNQGVYYALSLLEDMLPSLDQLQKGIT